MDEISWACTQSLQLQVILETFHLEVPTKPQVIFGDHSTVNVQRIKNDHNCTMEGKGTGEVEEIIPSIAKALK